MTLTQLSEPTLKTWARDAWRRMLEGHAAIGLCRPRPKGDVPRLFYGGARPGDLGGPKVKLQRLISFFPEHLYNFNILYLLSNTPYLSSRALAMHQRRGVPIVYNQNGVFYQAWYAGNWRARNAEMAVAYHAADYVFDQSDFCRRSADAFLEPRKGGGEVLFNAVDTSRFHMPPSKDRRGDQPLRFLITGKIDSHLTYRLTSSVSALAAARGMGLEGILTIAGWVSDDAKKEAMVLAEPLKIQDCIRFTGAYRQVEAPAIYQAADVYMMTKHNDPCPNTVLEALASGLPVVYSASGGVPELVGECGAGAPCEESWESPQVPETEALVSAMVKVAENLTQLSPAARARAVEMFDIHPWIERHAQVFRQQLDALP